MRLIQAKNYYRGRDRAIRFLVVHDMEAAARLQGGKDMTAENIAGWMAGRNAPMASAHFFFDSDSAAQGVKVGDTAFGAKGGNADGVHFEFKGYATWTRADWLAQDTMLNIGAAVMAEVAVALRRYGQAVNLDRPLSLMEVASRNVIGVTTHAQITRAFGIRGGHTDPGLAFPLDVFLAKVRWFVPHVRDLNFQ